MEGFFIKRNLEWMEKVEIAVWNGNELMEGGSIFGREE